VQYPPQYRRSYFPETGIPHLQKGRQGIVLSSDFSQSLRCRYNDVDIGIGQQRLQRRNESPGGCEPGTEECHRKGRLLPHFIVRVGKACKKRFFDLGC
jgi:hypothetical protein